MNIVYLTTNLINGKQYVGSHSTDNINDGYLGSGRIIRKAITKYDMQNFDREILEECDTIEKARKLEEKYIKMYNTISPNGYNLSPTGGCSHQGGKLSEEHKKKIGKALKGRKRDSEIGKKISKTRKKRGSYVFSEKHKEKISNTLKGRENGSPSEETIEKIRRGNIGNILSKETREKMSLSKTGTKLSKKHKEKISENNSKFWENKNFSSEHRNKLSKSHLGKKQKRKICPYCKKNIAVNIYARYHGEKCKFKNNI